MRARSTFSSRCTAIDSLGARMHALLSKKPLSMHVMPSGWHAAFAAALLQV